MAFIWVLSLECEQHPTVHNCTQVVCLGLTLVMVLLLAGVSTNCGGADMGAYRPLLWCAVRAHRACNPHHTLG